MQNSIVNPSIDLSNPAIADFLDSYPTSQSVRQRLWELVIAAMGSSHADIWDKETRAEILFLYELICNLTDTLYIQSYKAQTPTH